MNAHDWPLIEWVMDMRRELPLSQKRYSLAPWLPGHHCMTVQGFLGAFSIIGHAVGNNPHVTFAKALSEALERSACMRFGVNSNGFAAHPIEECARQAAWEELVERDAFLWHWHAGSSPVPVEMDYNPPCEAGESWSFYSLTTVDPQLHMRIAALKTAAGGIVLGLGCHLNPEKALIKAHQEACMLRESLRRHQKSSHGLEEFTQLSNPRPWDHLLLAQNSAYAQTVLQWLEGPQALPLPPGGDDKSVNCLGWHIIIKTPPPLFVARAFAPSLLSMTFGTPAAPLLGHPRLQGHLTNPLPHPFC